MKLGLAMRNPYIHITLMDQTIEKAKYGGGFSVYEHGEFPASSVMAGQARKSFLEGFNTVEEAQAAYPEAVEGYREANNTFGHLSGPDTLDGQGGVWGDY
jgi:hypothetical protein